MPEYDSAAICAALSGPDSITSRSAKVVCSIPEGGTIGAYRDRDGALHTVVPVCTHLGCPLRWNQGDATWDCNCHGSRFAPNGAVLDGPATTPLKNAD